MNKTAKQISIKRRFEVAAISNTGKLRLRNEDNYFYAFDPDENNLMAAVADGIGGGSSGDIASYCAAKLFADFWRDYSLHCKYSVPEISAFLTNSIREINRRLFLVNHINDASKFMGTTVVSSVFLNDSVVIAHAGDSRIYHIRNNKIQCLTRDHNLANELHLSEEEMQNVGTGHILTQSIGPNPNVTPDCSEIPFKQNDSFLLCSDGLMLHLSDPEILQCIRSSSDLQSSADNMIKMVLDRGGKDNVTLILVRIL